MPPAAGIGGGPAAEVFAADKGADHASAPASLALLTALVIPRFLRRCPGVALSEGVDILRKTAETPRPMRSQQAMGPDQGGAPFRAGPPDPASDGDRQPSEIGFFRSDLASSCRGLEPDV